MFFVLTFFLLSCETSNPNEPVMIEEVIAESEIETSHECKPVSINLDIAVSISELEEASVKTTSKKPKEIPKKKEKVINSKPSIDNDYDMCVGCNDTEEDQLKDDIDIQVWVNPSNGEYDIIIDDFKVD